MTDAERFDAIYREYRPKVSGYIGSHVSDPEDAEDLCSEVFRKVLEHLADHPSGGVSSFIYTVTRTTVVDYYRTRRVHAPLEEELPEEGGLEERVLNSDALKRLAEALRRLPQREREALQTETDAHERALAAAKEALDRTAGGLKTLQDALPEQQ